MGLAMTFSSETERRRAKSQVLDGVGRADDPRAWDQVSIGDPTRLGAGPARPDLPTVSDKRLDDIPERLEPFFADIVGVSLGRIPDPVDGQ